MKNSNSEISNRIIFIILIIFSFVIIAVNKGLDEMPSPYEMNKESIIAELKVALKSEFDLFYPLSIDTVDGGYFSDINYKWQLQGKQNKMIVTQARHVWSNANASMYYKKKEPFFKYAKHGFEFLKNKMWDKKYGGFFDLVDREGKPISTDGKIMKYAYGNAFAIYGLAAYYQAFGDTAALHLAQKTFYWMERHSYDPKYGGYFQFMKRNGTPYKNGFIGTPPKDQNSMIHILEAFTQLYKVWHNNLVKERLSSLFYLIRDTVIGSKPYLTLFMQRDCTPLSFRDSSREVWKKHIELDKISYGHNVETAYLLLEASDALGIKDDTKTIQVGKAMDDFALAHGWDNVHGGIYDGGYQFKGEDSVKVVQTTKQWWNQIEALNSFLMMSQIFPHDKHNYYDKFCRQWQYIKEYLIDHKYGGWYWNSIDTDPQARYMPKATIWKCNYHTTRGLINCIRRLESER